MAHPLNVELVVDPFGGSRELDEVMARVRRDLDVSAAICTLESAFRRTLVAWSGIEPVSLLLASGGAEARIGERAEAAQSGTWNERAGGLRSWLTVPISTATTKAALWAGDRRRRWFDHDEIHHARLLARRAAALLDEGTLIDLEISTPIELDRVLALH